MSDFILDTFLPYQLAVAADRVSRDFARTYQDRFGISIPEWRVLAHLSQSDAVSVREIHKRVGMDKSKVSRAASRLESAGHVTKRVNPDDRRLIELSLTEKGRALMAKLAPVASSYESAVMAELGTRADAFRDALETLMNRR